MRPPNPMSVGRIDPDSMEDADRSLIAHWMQEARENPPNIDEWAALVASLRYAAEMERRGAKDSRLPEGMTSAATALHSMLSFIVGHEFLKKDRVQAPLFRFFAAIVDISEGKKPTLFTPVVKLSHRPGDGAVQANVKGLCSRAMTELMNAGMPLKDAAEEVSKAARFGRVRGHDKLSAKKIQDWRDQIMTGAGSASPVAIERYNAPLPQEVGNTALARAQWLLNAIKNSPALQ